MTAYSPHGHAYAIEMPDGQRLIVVCIPAGGFTIGFDDAAELHESLGIALARALDPTPFPEAEPVRPYFPRSATPQPPRRSTALSDLA